MATIILSAIDNTSYKLPDSARLAIIAQSPYSKRCAHIEQHRRKFTQKFGNELDLNSTSINIK